MRTGRSSRRRSRSRAAPRRRPGSPRAPRRDCRGSGRRALAASGGPASCSLRAAGPRYTRSNMNLRSRSIAAADLLALGDVAAPRARSRRGRDERVDPRRAGRPEQLDLLSGQVALGEDPGPQGVVDVVVDVGDAVDEAHDPALERGRLARAGVVEDPVADRLGEVEPAAVALERVDDPQRVLVVPEARSRCARAAPGRAPPRRCARTADGRGRGRARSPRSGPRSAPGPARRCARWQASSVCVSRVR